jgi:hypothetical protein
MMLPVVASVLLVVPLKTQPNLRYTYVYTKM